MASHKIIRIYFFSSKDKSQRYKASIKKTGYLKTSKTYDILGCSYEEFKQYLESQFTEGMTWENKGEWHMDHIYPISLATDEDHMIKLNHYTNFPNFY